uniref:Uncharacterized protein n=1 Tax=Neolamprologus brichardi TaxID=32507 RepID=A0A3Q4MSS6_NEOBR
MCLVLLTPCEFMPARECVLTAVCYFLLGEVWNSRDTEAESKKQGLLGEDTRWVLRGCTGIYWVNIYFTVNKRPVHRTVQRLGPPFPGFPTVCHTDRDTSASNR